MGDVDRHDRRDGIDMTTDDTVTEKPDLEAFRTDAAAWLAEHLEPKPRSSGKRPWGVGSDSLAVFHQLTFEEERDLLQANLDWQQKKYDAGYGALTWPVEYGGRGLPGAYERAFRREESRFVTPKAHETHSVSMGLVGNTLRVLGTPDLREQFLRPLLRSEILACQLFSEPGAGSDLAGLSTRAVRDGDDWVVSGQKIWSSGAQFSQWGELLTRTNPDAPKHRGITAFMLDLSLPGVEVRPIKQMSGGSTFCEVFLTDVRIPDRYRIGEVDGGWKVALTTLGFERGGGGEARGGTYRDVFELAKWLGVTKDPVVRQELAELYIGHHVLSLGARRAAERHKAGLPPGPEGSISKLLFTRQQSRVAETAAHLLGPRLAANTGEWGTFAWSSFLLGRVGNRIAGGSDEIQHNIIGERVLGLPDEPRGDRDVAFKDIPR
ncbi:acyl-CoA dehydrogenase family protein [Nocardia sp. NPDC005366]|uniref:acyl-CoA dehydrogenase family protein n=1 Tax=Nocardia sp. NPDC005366 TaxID=3156878 RepID=UPI0033A24CE6